MEKAALGTMQFDLIFSIKSPHQNLHTDAEIGEIRHDAHQVSGIQDRKITRITHFGQVFFCRQNMLSNQDVMD